jgi:hypothetical protein
MRSLLFSLSAGAALTACASQPSEPLEPAPPPVSAFGEPVETFSVAASMSTIEGCSESEVGSFYDGTLTLHLMSGSRAALTFKGTSRDTYMSRRDGTTKHHRSRDYAVWAGEARKENGATLIELEPKGKRCEALPILGDGPGVPWSCLGYPMKRGEKIALRCALGAIKVIRPRGAGEEREIVEERPAMRCRPASRLPYPLHLITLQDDLSFPLDTGIRFSYIYDLGLDDARFEFVDTRPPAE